jgi:hypothetical protein
MLLIRRLNVPNAKKTALSVAALSCCYPVSEEATLLRRCFDGPVIGDARKWVLERMLERWSVFGYDFASVKRKVSKQRDESSIQPVKQTSI